jgi:hypothetical protein
MRQLKPTRVHHLKRKQVGQVERKRQSTEAQQQHDLGAGSAAVSITAFRVRTSMTRSLVRYLIDRPARYIPH